VANIAKKYAKAAVSSNLKCDERHSDVDVLMAVALCRVPLGPLLLRAKFSTTESNAGNILELKRAWLDVVAKTAFMKSWPEKISVKKVMATSIEYWMNDICPECKGRKSDQIDNTPCLTGVDCHVCNGTGKRPIPCDSTHAPYVETMVYALDGMALSARIAANSLMRED
jgi:hypothetical protein